LIHLLLITLISSFFFNDPATTEIYTLSLHDALPILLTQLSLFWFNLLNDVIPNHVLTATDFPAPFDAHREELAGRSMELRRLARSEEHTSELQSRGHLVCRLLLEKKNT